MEKLRDLLPSEDYDKLKDGNVTVHSLIGSSIRELHLLTGLSYGSLDRIVKEVSCGVGVKIVPVEEVPIWEKTSTGCEAIDRLTKGGIPLVGINEIVGCSGVGKTQLCLQLAIFCQLQDTEKGVIYINTDHSFPINRYHELVTEVKKKFNFPDLDLKSRVFLQHIANYEQIKQSLFVAIPNLLLTNKIALIIIDSIAGIFRSENVDVVYVDRSRQFVEIATQLNNLNKRYNVGVICVNQVTEDLENDETVPALGLSWSNLINCRFNITRFLGSNERQFEVVFSPHLRNETCTFSITREGIC